MKEIIKQLEEHFSSMTQEEKLKEWAEYDKYNSVGPTVNEFMGISEVVKFINNRKTTQKPTNLYDIKGNLIYHGDLLRSFDRNGEPIIHAIEWFEKEQTFFVTEPGYKLWCGDFNQEWINQHKKEIIGNMYVTV
jgi:hypothetical protein